MKQHIQYGFTTCSLGLLLAAASDQGICAILLGDEADPMLHDLHAMKPYAELIPADAGFQNILARIVDQVEHPAQPFDLALDMHGTAYQQQVWALLRTIPSGTTVSYSQLAQRLGTPNASRAVASACAANQLAVVIPCHRVLRSDGKLAGYRWGIERKQALLYREADLSSSRSTHHEP